MTAELNKILACLNLQNSKISNLLRRGDFMLAELYKKGRRNLELRAISAWRKSVDEEGIDTVIISIGSGNAPHQQCPAFTTALGSAVILNIDPHFERTAGYQKKNVRIDFLPSIIDTACSPQAYYELEDAITTWTHSNKKVIFMCHTYPFGFNTFIDIITNNLDKYGENFTYVGSYHEHQPIAVYSKDFFEAFYTANKAEISAFIIALWGEGRTLSSAEVNTLVEKHRVIHGSHFYSHLDQLHYCDLFPDVSLDKGRASKTGLFAIQANLTEELNEDAIKLKAKH